MEIKVIWKSSSSKKGALHKKICMQIIAFLKIISIQIVALLEKVDAVQKYLLWESSSSVDIVILKNSSAKVTTLKNYIFSRSGYSVEDSFWKCSYSEKINAAKKWLFWKRNFSKKATGSKK